MFLYTEKATDELKVPLCSKGLKYTFLQRRTAGQQAYENMLNITNNYKYTS